MFHMLSAFNLAAGVNVTELQQAKAQFFDMLQRAGLVECTGPLGLRQLHPVMDTDSARTQQYFFIMSFRDRKQCDQAVELIESHSEPCASIHQSLFRKIENSVFTCWEDLPIEHSASPCTA
jgi:hypothetical protein